MSISARLIACLLSALPLSLSAIGRAAEPPPRPVPPGQQEFLPPTLAWLRQVEAVQMLGTIVSGTPLMSGDVAWFHPGQSAYDWRWLAGRFDKDGDGAVSRREFAGAAEVFDRLDRNHDGRLTPVDFDWSEKSPVTRQMQTVHQLFRQADADKDDQLTSEEWQALFRQAARGKPALSREELHALLFPPPPPAPSPRDMAASMPSRATLLWGLLTGAIGSPCEGPRLGQPAPDFTLKTHDGDGEITLSHFRGVSPVVLVFGSFT
jgi:hypothetical protein